MVLTVLVFVTAILSKISAESPPHFRSDQNSSYLIVANLTTATFLDENHYIRLNISWGEVMEEQNIVSIRFRTQNDNCNPINDYEGLTIESDSFVIVPTMELEHPADQLMHGCIYEVTIEDNGNTNIFQEISYTVPECVENKCECKDIRNSPYKLNSINLLHDDVYDITWNKLTEDNLTVHEIYYQKINNSLKTYIPETNITSKVDGVEVPLPDLVKDVSYRVTIKFVDIFNECTYFSSINLKESPQKSVWIFILMGSITIAVLVIGVYIFYLNSTKIRNKINRFCFRRAYLLGTNENIYKPTHIPLCQLREEVNAQYTPLEFILNIHNYDAYEVSRNKVIIKEEIGQGAFGKVSLGKVYGLGDKQEFTMVAVKQLREGAPPEEITDFQNEIEILKKVGSHENIVRLLGCVTMEEPYMMIMDFVSGGSLKNYLLGLRQKWTRRKRPTIFFPDDMEEQWFEESDKKSSDGSYIQPDEVFDNPPSSPHRAASGLKALRLRNLEVPKSPGSVSQYSHTPLTPSTSSFTSSRLPSFTETEVTTVDLEPPTPSISEIRKCPEPVLDHTELQHFAFQIAKGMAYLEKINVAHRDLAARNILVTGEKNLKISDFGLSRTGTYVSIKSKKLPLRWMAIEAIEERTCDSKSDVWSFGVVLWEIGTLGAFPYKKTPDNLVLYQLKQGKRLERPEICTDEMYNLMLKCWAEKPDERLSFQQLVESLDTAKKKVYVDFGQINPKYVFPPTMLSDKIEIKENT